jgi:hypothetical protein
MNSNEKAFMWFLILSFLGGALFGVTLDIVDWIVRR